MKRFEGIFTVMLTVYDDNGDIDRDAMSYMTEHLIGAGVHGLVVLGSNGECPYLTHEHQRDAIDAVVESCKGRLPVIVGINERGTEQALEMASYAEGRGADGLLLALPLFYPLEEDCVYGYYEGVCTGTDLPVLYYNYPANTRLALSPESIARIAKIENMVGAKETIFDVDEVRGLVDATGDDFCVFTGMSFNLLATMSVGACGAICPLPNIIPEKIVGLYDAIVSGESHRAESVQNELYAYAPLLASSATPHALQKEAMRLLGHPVNNTVKDPLPQLTREQAKQVEDTLRQVGLI